MSELPYVGAHDSRLIALPITLLGVVSDWITTQIGLGMGYYETHPMYNPVLALVISWASILILLKTLPMGKIWDYVIYFIISWSFLGAINNILVITGVFNGLVM